MEPRNSDGRISNHESVKEVSLREGLLIHAASRPGGVTDQDRVEIDQIAPEPPAPSQYGGIGAGQRSPVRTGDVLEIRDHADWLARKEEILKVAFNPNY